mmetsp:Transcript_80203/g.248932  ORF Transcript_80203/g.248932 Transcript_80203/m.248932 type:complete len:225 (-) Transcript_80203:1063-1737(-)
MHACPLYCGSPPREACGAARGAGRPSLGLRLGLEEVPDLLQTQAFRLGHAEPDKEEAHGGDPGVQPKDAVGVGLGVVAVRRHALGEGEESLCHHEVHDPIGARGHGDTLRPNVQRVDLCVYRPRHGRKANAEENQVHDHRDHDADLAHLVPGEDAARREEAGHHAHQRCEQQRPAAKPVDHEPTYEDPNDLRKGKVDGGGNVVLGLGREASARRGLALACLLQD